MIPVRVPADAEPVLATDQRFTIAPDHPLAEWGCPVCDEPLVNRVTVLILAGIAPEDRKDSGYTTGAGVCVHAVCAGVSEEEPGA
jgi:hypothetical protein